MNRNFKTLGFYNNPLVVFGILTIATGLILFINTNFQIPDIYIDRNFVQQINNLYWERGFKGFYNIEQCFLNPDYITHTMIFQIFGWVLSLFIFFSLIKITSWQKVFELPIINKTLAFLWINIPTIFVAFIKLEIILASGLSYISAPHDHSMGLFGMFWIGVTFLFLIFYYIVVNLVYFFIYSKNTKSGFVKFLLYVFLVTIFGIMILDCFYHFNWLIIVCNLYYLAWIYLITSTIKFMEEK